MTIKKQANGKYLVDIYPNGRSGDRVRKTFTTQGEAKRFEKYCLAESQDKPWKTGKADDRRLTDLVELWFSLHGQALSDGAKRKNKLIAMMELMGNPLARNFKTTDFSKYRQVRLDSVSIKTVNNEQSYLNALFNELKRLGEWQEPNPIEGLRTLKYQPPAMGFLEPEDIPVLFDELKQGRNPDTYLIAKICISTGCRWGEAESLTRSQISPYRLTFTQTKGNKHRTVPISEALYDELADKQGKLFGNSIKSFSMAIKRAGIELPKGQSTHVLRHTFASHFMMNGGNILVLQQILGHASITDTMKYAHFSPTHLEDAVKLNPLSTISL